MDIDYTNKNRLITFLEESCAKSGDLRTDFNILRQLRLLNDGELMDVFDKLYKPF